MTLMVPVPLLAIPPPRKVLVSESPPFTRFSLITLLVMFTVPSFVLETPPPLPFELAAPGTVTVL